MTRIHLLLAFCLATLTAAAQDKDSSSMKTDTLKEVTVLGKRKLLDIQPDRTIVDVNAMISASAGHALDVLEKIPGVTVNHNGEISLNGRGGVMVMINGKMNYLSGPDLLAYLKTLPGTILDKVELMDNPPSKYDAAAGAIINIRLKKNRKPGITGALSGTYSQGVYARSSLSANLNYHRGNHTLFAGAGIGKEKNYVIDEHNRLFFNETGEEKYAVDLVNHDINRNRSYHVNLGWDYRLSSKTILGFSLNFNENIYNGAFSYHSSRNDSNTFWYPSAMGNTSANDKRRNTSAGFNIQHQFNEKGHELSGDIQYFSHGSEARQTLENHFKESGNDSSNLIFYHLPASIDVYVTKADYLLPVNKSLKLEAGVKSGLITYDNIADHYDVKESGRVLNDRNSNHFRYRELINAAYVNTRWSWKKLQVDAGLRLEQANTSGRQFSELFPQSFRKNYLQAFPGLYLTFKPDSSGKHVFGLVALKRINRPQYYLLNPFIVQKDRYSFNSGNPSLDPQYQYRIELKYNYKQALWTGLSYNHFTGVILRTTRNENGIFLTHPQNVSRGYMLLLNAGSSWSPNKWWSGNGVVRISGLGLRGASLYGENLNMNATVLRVEILNNFRIDKSTSAELGGYYASKDINAQTVTSGMYRVHAGLLRKMMKDKMAVKLVVDDIFHSWVYRYRSANLKDALFYQRNETDTQRFTLSLSYRFGKEGSVKSRRRGNAAGEEQGRVITGDNP